MSFKVVSTEEKRGICFCVVPNQWENGGTLFWPGHLKHSQRETLRRNPASCPDDDWELLECIVKFSDIENYKDALTLERQLTSCVDTDAEETLFLNMKNRKRATTKKTSDVNQLTDRNDLFTLENQSSSARVDNKINNISSQVIPNKVTNAEYKTLFVQDDGSLQIIDALQENSPLMSQQLPPEPVITNVGNEIKLFREELTDVKNEISTIKGKIFNMKEELTNNYKKINLNLDKIHKTLSDINFIPKAAESLLTENDLLKDINFPLKSCEEIQALDLKIRHNMEFKKQLITFLSKIGGTSREEDGGKVAYKVIDQVFSPSVLINYTWTGVARGKNATSKKPFQIFEGILDIFFQVISLADSRHTKQKNCNIFKDGVLKYATKRSLRKRSKPVSNINSVPQDEENKNEDINNQLETNSVNSQDESDLADADGEEDDNE